MWIVVAGIIAIVAWWIYRTKKYDRLTTIDFDVWLSKYQTASSSMEKVGMEVALISQSVHMAWSLGAINSKERDAVTKIMHRQGASTTMLMWLGMALPAVNRVVGEREVSNFPARTVGAFMLLAWMAPKGQGEESIRAFLMRR